MLIRRAGSSLAGAREPQDGTRFHIFGNQPPVPVEWRTAASVAIVPLLNKLSCGPRENFRGGPASAAPAHPRG